MASGDGRFIEILILTGFQNLPGFTKSNLYLVKYASLAAI